MQLNTIRGWQIDHMQKSILAYEALVNTLPASNLTTYRDGGEGWSAVAVLCHLRDFEDLFFYRARITVQQDNPDLPFPKPDDLAAEKQYFAQDPKAVIAEWKQIRRDYIAWLQQRNEADWERPAKHPTRGLFTLHDQLFVVAQHDMNHMEQFTRILAEKKG